VRQEDLQRSFGRHSGCWGSTTIRTLLLRTGDRAQSELERLAVSLLRGAGITGFKPNITVRLKDGQAVEIDIAFPDRRIAIELDGYAFHSGADAFRDDVRPGNRLMADGWTVRRFTWDDLVDDPDGFVGVVLELLCVDHLSCGSHVRSSAGEPLSGRRSPCRPSGPARRGWRSRRGCGR